MRELAGHLRDAGADADQIAALLVLGPVLRQTWSRQC